MRFSALARFVAITRRLPGSVIRLLLFQSVGGIGGFCANAFYQFGKSLEDCSQCGLRGFKLSHAAFELCNSFGFGHHAHTPTLISALIEPSAICTRFPPSRPGAMVIEFGPEKLNAPMLPKLVKVVASMPTTADGSRKARITASRSLANKSSEFVESSPVLYS